MGVLSVRVQVANPSNGEHAIEQELLVDTGAYMSVLPRAVLEQLGIRPVTRRPFGLADGKTRIERDVGGALFTYGEYAGVSPVVFGEESDKSLLGVLTLEALGLTVDPVKGELKPVEMFLL
jgi:clan AA aspartic protease